MSESADVPAETPVDERRATEPLEQLLHLAVAEDTGILPDEDRREPEPVHADLIPDGGSEAVIHPVEAVVDAPSGIIAGASQLPVGEKTPELHIVKDRGDGVLVDGFGCLVIR